MSFAKSYAFGGGIKRSCPPSELPRAIFMNPSLGIQPRQPKPGKSNRITQRVVDSSVAQPSQVCKLAPVPCSSTIKTRRLLHKNAFSLNLY
jgi:hypothetical protein